MWHRNQPSTLEREEIYHDRDTASIQRQEFLSDCKDDTFDILKWCSSNLVPSCRSYKRQDENRCSKGQDTKTPCLCSSGGGALKH